MVRDAKNWTQTMLADHAALTREHLSELEKGHKEIGIRTLERLAAALEVQLKQLFED